MGTVTIATVTMATVTIVTVAMATKDSQLGNFEVAHHTPGRSRDCLSIYTVSGETHYG